MAKGGSEKKTTSKVEIQVEPEPQEPPEPDPPPNTIQIRILSYENIKTVYPVSDLTIKFELKGATIFESEKTQVLRFDILETDFDFDIPCDLSNPIDRDLLITAPLTISVTETERIVDTSAVEILAPAATEIKPTVPEPPPPPPEIPPKKGQKEKGGKGKKSKKGSEKTSSIAETSQLTLPIKPTGPQLLGIAKLDLLPIFLGYSTFDEALCIEKSPPVFDETATSLENLLKVKVNVSLEGEPLNIDSSTILHLTVESAYNIPSLVATDFQYELCCLIPGEHPKLEPIIFNKGRITNENTQFKYKLWPKVTEEQLPIPSTYRIPDDVADVKNATEIDIEPFISSTTTRIEWNFIKRSFFGLTQVANFHRQIGKYRKIPVEIYITPVQQQVEDQPPGKDAKKKKDTKDKASSKTGGTSTEAPPTEYDSTIDFLHVMANIDAGYLLYPGVKKCRVACPLRTYQEVEILEETGLEDSYFRPRPPPKPVESIEKGGKGGKGDKGGKGGKGSKGGKDSKSGKSGKGKGKGAEPVEGKDLAESLPPPPPPPPPPSKQIYNDAGDPAFIILELELFNPLSPIRHLEYLDDDMCKFIAPKPSLSKKFISSKVAQDIHGETIRSILTDINAQYKSYLEDKTNCQCDLDSFQSYIQKSGAYQVYITSILRSLSTLIPQKYGYKKNIFQSSNEYQKFVSDVYVDMIRDMNRVVNEQQLFGASFDDHKHLTRNEKLLLYAKEAMELGEQNTADRYYLERICCREDDPNVWFDYAVFQLEINDVDKAKECVTETVQLDFEHKFGLMMYGLMLFDKGMILESETCFLRMVCLNPTWVEGWIITYAFYKQTGNLEGAEYCWDMAKKGLAQKTKYPTDYFSQTPDLAWSEEKLDDNVFLKTAGLLIKMRLHQHAEKVLSYALFTHKGFCKYLYGVIAYLQKDYEKALEFLETAEKLIGLDYGVTALIGHCNIKLYQFEEAAKYFDIVLEMFNRPEDIHLVFMNGAMANDVIGDSQKARQLSLHACKFSATPQSWLFAGGFYFKQNDLLSAEECLIQSNLCDNRLSETWAYLALINYNLKKTHQYYLCMAQAKKFNVENKDLIGTIEEMVANQEKQDK
ncbi:cilia- and flagella-associated protein 70-like isoform X1 [Onthophagus taurus]|uniref:cilia- and flagella-associated protein 70-like isoform X1 n=1 Tax=Onthophagus taurus TaxID=166361 RepID=UPI0039BEA4DC